MKKFILLSLLFFLAVNLFNSSFMQENYLGVQPETKTGGGVPMVDLRNHRSGIAIAHIDTKPRLVSFPVN